MSFTTIGHWLTLKGEVTAQETAELIVVCRCGAECFLGEERQEPAKFLAELERLHHNEVVLTALRDATRAHGAALVAWADSNDPISALVMIDDRPWIAAMREAGIITDESMVQP